MICKHVGMSFLKIGMVTVATSAVFLLGCNKPATTAQSSGANTAVPPRAGVPPVFGPTGEVLFHLYQSQPYKPAIGLPMR